jgi:hypothetical protein
MLYLLEGIPKIYYGLLLAIGFCIYYLCEVVKVSKNGEMHGEYFKPAPIIDRV